jgi:hypothetical protein
MCGHGGFFFFLAPLMFLFFVPFFFLPFAFAKRMMWRRHAHAHHGMGRCGPHGHHRHHRGWHREDRGRDGLGDGWKRKDDDDDDDDLIVV